MEKFRNRFRISSSRLNSWNYGWNGEYFVTVCTKARINYFGNIVDDEMNFNSIGYWATLCWREIPHHFPFVKLGAFVVMPNHIHGIIIIDKIPVETQDFASLQTPNTQNIFGRQSKNLASIVRGFKIGVTKASRSTCPEFWRQPGYHDHIIMNADDYMRIEAYINNNPVNWKSDRYSY